MSTNASPADFSASVTDQTVPMVLPIKPSDEADCSNTLPQDTQAIRVLHVVNGEHFSGAERVQSHLGRCLPNVKVQADFACVKPGRFADMLDEHSLSEKLPSWGRGFRVGMRNRWDLRAVRQLAALIRKHDYQLLHAHTPRSALVASLAARMTGVPWVYHVHSPASRDSDRALSNHLNAWIEKACLRNCSHLICVSNSLKEDMLAQGFRPENVSVVHNGVPAIRPERYSFPVVGQRWTIGMVALMRPRKGLEVVLEALAQLRQRGTDVTLRCIGPFETEAYRQKIDQQISDLQIGDLIEWVGFTNDVPAELIKLDAMALPSLFGEGLPMVVLEAMAAAVPTIATRVEGTPEAIRHGHEGLLAEPRNATSFADQIQALVTGQYDWGVMSESAAKRHGERFSDHAMAEGTAKVYRKLLMNR